jgi:hypothetical protein
VRRLVQHAQDVEREEAAEGGESLQDVAGVDSVLVGSVVDAPEAIQLTSHCSSMAGRPAFIMARTRRRDAA